MNQKKWRKLQGLYFAVKPVRGWIGAGAVLLLFSGALENLQPWLTGKLVDSIVDKQRQGAEIAYFCVGLFALFVVRAAATFLHSFWIQKAGLQVADFLRRVLYQKTLHLPIQVYDETPVGRLLTRMLNDVKSFSQLFTPSMVGLVLDGFTVLFAIVTMFWMQPWLAVASLVPVPFVFLGVAFFSKRLEAAYRDVRATLASINAFLGEKIPAVQVIQQLGAEPETAAAFDRLSGAHEHAQKETVRVFAYVQPVANVLHGLSTAILLAFGGYLVTEGKTTVGTLIAFLGYIRNIFQPVRDFVDKYNQFLSAFVSIDRIEELLATPPEWEEKVPGSRGAVGPALGVEFRKVFFRYPTREDIALQSVSVALSPGSSLAVVGPTGSGKSTLARLLLGFYRPDSGTVLVGDKSVSEWSLPELRRQIAYVPQEVYLFEGTLADNLRFGLDDISDARLRQACEDSFLWEFVASRGGLQCAIEETGRNLSAGERQLVAFTRTLLMDAPILILDEATSSLDSILEDRLLRATRKVMGNRTTILIAHRPTTLQLCDNVIALRHGKVVHYGLNEVDLTEELRAGSFA